ncbi:MAG TPA: hypothetical protein VFS16_11040 [Acidimicrobiia bacterium]|nr:hypothetical protein [Acidimicrobiia bacterium]
MNERRNRRLAGWITGTTMIALLLGPVGPARADELEDLALGQAWRGWSDARLVVPTAGLPYELNPTPTAFARSYIDTVPGRSSAFASFYYADEILEEGVFEIGPGGGFKNPTLTRCNNPDAGRGTSGKVEEGSGGVGRKAVTDCTSRLKATGNSNTGPLVTQQLTISDGYVDTKATATRGLQVTEATARLVGVAAGDLRIGAIESWVKIEHPIDGEPLVSYKVSATNVASGKTSAVEAGSPKGFSIGGSAVPASQLVEQFNTQANKTGATAAPDQQTWQLDVLAPRVYKPGDTPGRAFGDFSIINPREIAIFAPVVRLRMNNYWCCKNAGGEHTGFYLGWARARSYIDASGNSINVVDTPPEPTTGDSLAPDPTATASAGASSPAPAEAGAPEARPGAARRSPHRAVPDRRSLRRWETGPAGRGAPTMLASTVTAAG